MFIHESDRKHKGYNQGASIFGLCGLSFSSYNVLELDSVACPSITWSQFKRQA